MTNAKLDLKFPQLHNAGDYSMKLRRKMSVMAIAVLIAVATIAGCSRKTPPPAPPPPAPPPPPVVQQTPPPPPPPQPQPQPPPPSPPAPLTEEQIYQKTPLEEISRQLSEVLFDYDQFSIREGERAGLQKNADFMRRRTTSRVQVEGHADARGTNEYNLALGERRASAVRDYMIGLGIAADRISVVSRGEETPVCTEDTDACHARNRRGLFAVTQR